MNLIDEEENDTKENLKNPISLHLNLTEIINRPSNSILQNKNSPTINNFKQQFNKVNKTTPTNKKVIKKKNSNPKSKKKKEKQSILKKTSSLLPAKHSSFIKDLRAMNTLYYNTEPISPSTSSSSSSSSPNSSISPSTPPLEKEEIISEQKEISIIQQVIQKLQLNNQLRSTNSSKQSSPNSSFQDDEKENNNSFESNNNIKNQSTKIYREINFNTQANINGYSLIICILLLVNLN